MQKSARALSLTEGLLQRLLLTRILATLAADPATRLLLRQMWNTAAASTPTRYSTTSWSCPAHSECVAATVLSNSIK